MTMRAFSTFLLLTALILQVFAQDGQQACSLICQGLEKKWSDLDVNKDEGLSKAEMSKASWQVRLLLWKYFNTMDEDKNEIINKPEWRKTAQKLEEKRSLAFDKKWQEVDTNQNGEITEIESKRWSYLAGHFQEFDVDKNGVLSKEECKKAFDKTSLGLLGLE